jgi:hypothetical protein
MQELKPYSFFDLQNKFKLSEEELNDTLKSLSLMNIVKRLSKDTSKIELEELLETDNLEKLNAELEGNMYVFKYVGIIVIGDACLLIYPKYANSYLNDSTNEYQQLKQLISVIRKYQSKEQKIGFNDQLEADNFNLLSIALELIYSYYDHGLYSNDKQIIEQNGYGEILWEKTINESTVYFSNGLPVYLDTFTVNQENNEQDYFRRLHAFILSEVCKKLKDILLILDIDTIIISSEEREYFGNSEYISYRINQELSSQFVTYKQNILNLMKKYIEENYGKSSSTTISFVGTNSFNLVWEDVCSVAMDDCINKSIKELGLKYSQNAKQSALLSDVISKPKWKHHESGKVHSASKTLIPDIVTIKEDKLSIYDAKYYKIKLDEQGVDNQPGVGDVTKQYLYELAYKDFAKENNLAIDSNAFLMPTDEKEEKKVGTTSIDIFSNLGDIRLLDIDVILKPCEEMYEIYLEK